MPQAVLSAFPSDISHQILAQLLDDLRSREAVRQAMIQHLEKRYGRSLETLESRLARGEGPEHPDWEDSIEWRNAVESVQRTRIMRRLIEWLLRSTALSPTS